jgi:hypothetical protein
VTPSRRRARLALAAAAVGVIYWNWYDFTTGFFAAQGVDVLGGWIVVGAVLAALAPQPA